MPWWKENRMRMVQFNLIGSDAKTDIDQLVAWLKDMHANAVMIGAGGIITYYRTNLPYAYMSPFMGDKDMLGEVIEKCHANGIRVIGRFDFSKIHESVAEKHPEWLYRDVNGEIVNYHGMVHTCVCGDYQNLLSHEVLRDCLTRYPVDGLYFNMFGFAGRRDYDGIDHGICHCEGCQRRFKEMTGFDLPKNEQDEHMEAYSEFQFKIVEDLTARVYNTVKSINPEISICTHDFAGVDMVHTESNTALRRKPRPFNLYGSSDQCRMTPDSNSDIFSANCVINAADIAWRFMGVSPYLTQIRLWQNVAAGSQPEWCIVGVPENYPETKAYDFVREVFQYHEKNEQYLGQRKTLAEIALVHPIQRSFCTNTEEYNGVFKALKEGHYNFDIIFENRLTKVDLSRYKTIILPGITVDPAILPETANILATGCAYNSMSVAAAHREWGNNNGSVEVFTDVKDALKTYFGGEEDHVVDNNAGAYLLCKDKQLFKRIPKCDWILLDGPSSCIRFEEGALDYMAPGVFGPVEIAGGTFPSGFWSVGIKRMEKRTNVLIPWEIGKLYDTQGFQEHRDVLLDILDMLGTPGIETNAHPMVEMFCDGCEGGRIIQMVNLTGCNGVAVHQPAPFANVQIAVPAEGASKAIDLRSDSVLPTEVRDGKLYITLPHLGNFGAILIPNP